MRLLKQITKVTFTRGEDVTISGNAVVGITSVAQDAADNNKVNVTFDKAVDGTSATNQKTTKLTVL